MYYCIVLLLTFIISFYGCATSPQTDELLIHSASSTLDIDKIRKLIKNGADVNAFTAGGMTPLLFTSVKGDIEVVKLLLAANADVNAAGKYGITPLLIASEKGHTEVVKLLLAANADVNIRVNIDGIGYTPLSIARQYSHKQIIEILKQYGAKD